MTIEEIRAALKARGWTQKELASMLHVHPVTLGLILTGKNKLTPQLAAHIELLLTSKREQLFIHKVSLPDCVVEHWVPGFEELNEEQRTAAVVAVLNDAAKWLIREGEKQFSAEELARLKNFCSTLGHMPPREYECAVDDEGQLVEAAEEDDE